MDFNGRERLRLGHFNQSLNFVRFLDEPTIMAFGGDLPPWTSQGRKKFRNFL